MIDLMIEIKEDIHIYCFITYCNASINDIN